MAQEKIACPSCGGMGIIGSVCEYCGSVIQMPFPITFEHEKGKVGRKVMAEQYADKISKYQSVSGYYGDLAIVSIGGRFGCINKHGDLIIGLTNDEIVPNTDDSLFFVRTNGKTALYNFVGRKLVDFIYDDIEITLSGFFKGCMGKYYGLINKEGEEIVSVNSQYEDIIDTNCGFFQVRRGKYWGIIKSNGDIAVSFEKEYQNIDAIENGLFQACKKGHWGIINTEGREILPFIYERIFFHGNLYRLQEIQTEKWGIMNLDMQIIIPCEYDGCYIDGLYIKIRKKWKRGLYSIEKQKMLLPCVYDDLKIKTLCAIIVQNDGDKKNVGLYGLKKESILLPCTYDDICMQGEFIIVKKWANNLKQYYLHGLYRFQNEELLEILPCTYRQILIKDYWIKVQKEEVNGWGIVKFTGEVLIPCQYDKIDYDCSGSYLELFYANSGKPSLKVKICKDNVLFNKENVSNSAIKYPIAGVLSLLVTILFFLLDFNATVLDDYYLINTVMSVFFPLLTIFLFVYYFIRNHKA